MGGYVGGERVAKLVAHPQHFYFLVMVRHCSFVYERFLDKDTKKFFPCHGIIVIEALNLVLEKIYSKNPIAWKYISQLLSIPHRVLT
jgi:hypothetical protein